MLAVNVASKCGLTPQYTGLEELHEELAKEGFAVVGFPCNQFGAQEPGSEKEIKIFCSANYGVTFPMSAKLEVNGSGRHPLYAWLTDPGERASRRHPVEFREIPDRPRRAAAEALCADDQAARQRPDAGHRRRALSERAGEGRYFSFLLLRFMSWLWARL